METALIFILAKKLLSDTNNSFIVFVLSSPLRPLSRVASDYFSDSVVCIGILRPLRPLREIKRQSSLICGQLTFTACKKTLHLCIPGAGRGNPRIVKARSSHGISHEHERADA